MQLLGCTCFCVWGGRSEGGDGLLNEQGLEISYKLNNLFVVHRYMEKLTQLVKVRPVCS